jgi:hypothetical protein
MPYVQCVRKQLWSTFFPIQHIGGVFEKCDGSSGCMWKKLGIAPSN